MTFQFETLLDFWNMAGHGPYVWASYGITWVGLIYLMLAPGRRRKQLLENIRRQARIESQQQSTQKQPSQ